jgi:hypothetical protein
MIKLLNTFMLCINLNVSFYVHYGLSKYDSIEISNNFGGRIILVVE